MKYVNIIAFSLLAFLYSCANVKGKTQSQHYKDYPYPKPYVNNDLLFLLPSMYKVDSSKGAHLYYHVDETVVFWCGDTSGYTTGSKFVLIRDAYASIYLDSSFTAGVENIFNSCDYSGKFKNGLRQDTFRLSVAFVLEGSKPLRLVEVFDSLGLRHGYYTAYDTLGKRIHRGYFEHGTGYDKEFWYDTRGIRQKGRYVKGYKTGVWYYYDRHSKLRRKEYYEMGKLMKAVEVQQRILWR